VIAAGVAHVRTGVDVVIVRTVLQWLRVVAVPAVGRLDGVCAGRQFDNPVRTAFPLPFTVFDPRTRL